MEYMFSYCKFPANFSLGNNFEVTPESSKGLFCYCNIPDSLDLGSKFCVNSAEQALGMFDIIDINRKGLDETTVFDFIRSHGGKCGTVNVEVF